MIINTSWYVALAKDNVKPNDRLVISYLFYVLYTDVLNIYQLGGARQIIDWICVKIAATVKHEG